ncbi:MAG: hypothetical protein QXO30_07815 [Candidatus Caldarchaeum sp.]
MRLVGAVDDAVGLDCSDDAGVMAKFVAFDVEKSIGASADICKKTHSSNNSQQIGWIPPVGFGNSHTGEANTSTTRTSYFIDACSLHFEPYFS